LVRRIVTVRGREVKFSPREYDLLRLLAAHAGKVLTHGMILREVWGGETTVTVRGSGKGGRNQELALAAAIRLEGTSGVAVVSFGTDGVDGSTKAAGAYADSTTVERARELGLDPRRHLGDNDSNPFFEALGDLVMTGPTGTNVNDVMIAIRA
ncbi:MAG: winged helix-turn-helix domain-containing protein, partial [Nitrososphaerota archaeon]|nr:winged helix-turn-helix domain-containing protein [Nitrososphaerota archaeon]